ncbi:MFS transporter [Echinicola jeungdonensis]|uniref:MFS transporter n=1 Tax=Echinicola jeungdonensis TaxID=709343 RepID=A0ABV5J3C1_9BACT|nr:MFS transporter [Echinicola jeungdonensis]MDN3670590.1 MFS transporter [Echinicola jeungdonensis]
MNYLKFVGQHFRLLFFGIMMTFLSSFGQTFLLGLYVPFIMKDFDLKNSEVSLHYMIATFGSAFLIPYAGKFIDRIPIRKYTLGAMFLFLMALALMATIEYWFLIPIAFFGLRLAGQGLFSHISMTAMSKYFNKGRGKAISLASLGHPLGQAFLPLLVLAIIEWVGWRQSLFVNAGLVAFMVCGYLIFFLKNQDLSGKEKEIINVNKGKALSQKEIIKTKSFWLLAPNMFILSFTVTGLFFYQFSIAEFKSWPMEDMALGLTFYAVAGSVFILFSGPLIDKYSARKFFPYYLIPFLVAIVFIGSFGDSWVIFPYMILMGASSGFGGALKSALQVEFFGSTSIGSVRSLFTSIMVLSSAIGPAAFGLILDAGFTFEEVFLAAGVLVAIVIVLSFRAIPKFTLAKYKYKFKQRHRRFDSFK